MDGHQITTLLSTSLCVCLLDCHRSGFCIRQDEPPWYLPRLLYAPSYRGFRYYAMGNQSRRPIRRYLLDHYWCIPRWSWLPCMGGEQCGRSGYPLSLNCLRCHTGYCWRYSRNLVRQIMLRFWLDYRLTHYRTYTSADAPRYPIGHTINLCGQICVCILAVFGICYCKWENKQRDQGKRDHRLVGKTAAQIKDLGYRHPEFRYIH
jgi:hypothetical protein